MHRVYCADILLKSESPMNDFASMFEKATGHKRPHDYQSRLALSSGEKQLKDQHLFRW